MIDTLLIVLIITIESVIATTPGLAISWNCTQPNSDDIVTITMEPLALVFIIVFGVLLAVQFTCLILHQSFSFLQIVSSVKLSCKKHTDIRTMTTDEKRVDTLNAIELARRMQVLLPEDIGCNELTHQTQAPPLPEGSETSSTVASPTQPQHSNVTASSALLSPGNNSTLSRAFAASYMAIAADQTAPCAGRFAPTIRNLQQANVFSKAGVNQVREQYNIRPTQQALQKRRLSVMFEPIPDYD